MKHVAYYISTLLLVLSSCGNKSGHRDPELQAKIAACRAATMQLPETCIPSDNLREETGGIINVEVTLACGQKIFCTWACVPKRNKGPLFKVQHGPWTLCELCFNTDPLPKACYQRHKPTRPSQSMPLSNEQAAAVAQHQ